MSLKPTQHAVTRGCTRAAPPQGRQAAGPGGHVQSGPPHPTAAGGRADVGATFGIVIRSSSRRVDRSPRQGVVESRERDQVAKLGGRMLERHQATVPPVERHRGRQIADRERRRARRRGCHPGLDPNRVENSSGPAPIPIGRPIRALWADAVAPVCRLDLHAQPGDGAQAGVTDWSADGLTVSGRGSRAAPS